MWKDNIVKLMSCLDNLIATDSNSQEICCDNAFLQLKEKTDRLRVNKGTIFLVGNGASSSMASHVSADLAKNAHVHTQVFTDLSLITAIANDISYDAVFSEPLRKRMHKDDMLVAISSSGNSKNILNAAKVAQEQGGYVVTLSAMKPENPLRRLGHVNFYVPATTYGMAETSHNAILHYWIDLMTGDACV